MATITGGAAGHQVARTTWILSQVGGDVPEVGLLGPAGTGRFQEDRTKAQVTTHGWIQSRGPLGPSSVESATGPARQDPLPSQCGVCASLKRALARVLNLARLKGPRTARALPRGGNRREFAEAQPILSPSLARGLGWGEGNSRAGDGRVQAGRPWPSRKATPPSPEPLWRRA